MTGSTSSTCTLTTSESSILPTKTKTAGIFYLGVSFGGVLGCDIALFFPDDSTVLGPDPVWGKTAPCTYNPGDSRPTRL